MSSLARLPPRFRPLLALSSLNSVSGGRPVTTSGLRRVPWRAFAVCVGSRFAPFGDRDVECARPARFAIGYSPAGLGAPLVPAARRFMPLEER